MRRVDLQRAVRRLGVCIAVFVTVCCASGETEPEEGSETHFLMRCAGDCGPNFVCLCGICTQGCAQAGSCAELGSQASCVPLAPRVAEQRCASATEASYCDAGCLVDADCSTIGEGAHCDRGFCRLAPALPPTVAPLPCQSSELSPAELVVLGDSLFELSGFEQELTALARTNGALTIDERYRDYSSSAMSFLADGPFSVGTQYTTSQGEGAARVVVMNGGATDMLQNPCLGALTSDCPEVRAAARGAELLFQRLASDGVEHVIYLWYPTPRANPMLQAGLETLRSLVQNACGKSLIPCHWLELGPIFAGHDDYLGPDGIVFSTAGARASADALWRLMEARCVPR